MTPQTETLTTILSIGTLLMDIGVVVMVGAYLLSKRAPSLRGSSVDRALTLLGTHALPLAFILTLVGVAGTLYYSEVAGFEPCKLCWFQRIFFYPQLVIFGVALLKKGRDAFLYALPLSVIGFGIALYHYAIQRGVSSPLPCSADVAASCSKQFFFMFGYITEVMMSVTAFAGLIALALAYRYAHTRTAD